MLPASVAAELPPPPPLHNAETAVCRINELVRIVDSGTFSDLPDELSIFTEKTGLVRDSDMDELRSLFRASDAKNNQLKPTVRSIGLVVPDSTNPVYAVDIVRGRWGSGSVWLVWFRSNEIAKFKEAPELYRIAARNDVFAPPAEFCEAKKHG